MDMKSVRVYALIGGTFMLVLANDTRIAFIHTEWFQSWWWVSLFFVFLYAAGLYYGQQRMAKREALNVRQALAYWNFGLALFSILGLYRNGSEFIVKLYSRGLKASYCEDDYYHDVSVYFWYFLFVISKLFELGDTVFLVLRKKRVAFIHWFHHMVTMVYSFYIAAYLPAMGRWMSTMNFWVHSFMYTYYWLMANGIRLPKPLAQTITIMQIVQMFAGLTVGALAVWSKHNPAHGPCGNGGLTSEAGTVMYLFYVFLFLHFFYNAYLRPRR